MSLLALALPFSFDRPMWLWLGLLIPLLILASLRSLAGLEFMRRTMALFIRSMLVLLVACCLARVEHVQRNDDLTVIYLMDRSHSVQELQNRQEAFVHQASDNIPDEDRVGLIDFARDAFLQQLPTRGGYYISPGRLPAMPNTDRTNVAAGMRLAMAMFPHDTAKRIVLMSDGNDNMGDLLAEARRARADGIPVDVVPLDYQHRNEIYFDRLIAPTHAEPGEQVAIRMVINSQRPASGTIILQHNGRLVAIPDRQARVELRPGDNTFYMKLSVDDPGSHVFEATFRPDDESMDATARNNTGSTFTFVAGTSHALLITADPDFDAAFVDALRSENVKVAVKTTDQLGEFGLLQMMNYATIILSNVPAAALTDKQQEELALYVKDMGSGLIMLGGDEGYGAGGWIGSPVEEVMPVSFEIKHKRVIPRGALALIIHSCEIARGNFWGKEMAKKSVDTISSQDYIGVLAYSWSPGGENWEVPLDLNTNKAAVKNKIDKMQIGDMPDFGTTMQMAYRGLVSGKGRDAAQKHVIILSDGDASPPLPRLISQYKKAKITVSTIAIGWGGHVMASTMQSISRATGGKFYQARNPRQLPQIFTKESKVVRRPLIVDEPFQPQLLHSYSEILAGIDPTSDALPPLGGMIMTSPKQNPNVIVPIIRATDDGEDPVLAHWQYELGKTVAFTSGYWPVWGRQWTQWPKFAKLWAQIVRWTMRQDAPANFDTYTKIDGNSGRIVIDALDKDASYLNLLQLRTSVIGPDNQPVPVEFIQTGPGHYEAQVPIDKAGQYLANVRAIDASGRSMGTLRTGLSAPFSPEYRDLMPNEALLRQVVDETDGRWLDMPAKDADVFSHDLPPTEARRPAWEWVLAWLLLPMFLLDVAVRRLASWLAFSIAVELVVLVFLLIGLDIIHTNILGVFGAFLLAELIGWMIRFRYIGPLFDYMTHTVTALGRAGERSTASLDKLKSKKDEVRSDLDGEKDRTGKVSTGEETLDPLGPIPLANAKQRFDVGDAKASKPSADLADALGGAAPNRPPAKPDRPPAQEDQGDDQETTSRLLRAKRRAKRKEDNGS